MKLYAIEEEEDLKGKEILDIHILGHSVNEILILTTDGGVFLAQTYPDDDDCLIQTVSESGIAGKLLSSKLFKNQMLTKGKFTQDDLDEFTAEQRARRRLEEERRQKRAEQYEQEEYLRLKEKFEAKK